MNTRQFWCSLLLGLLLAPVPAMADDTRLRLAFYGPGHEHVVITRAELLVVAWGLTERLPLQATGNTLNLDMSESWLRAQSNVAPRLRDLERVFLYVKAAGYAPVRSDAFLWVGAHGGDYGLPRVTTTTVMMSGGAPVTLSEGTTVEAAVVLRPPQTRVLRFVEESGAPVGGLDVQALMFWSHSNHCGVLAGADSLMAGKTDRNGDVTVPDGEFDYALVLPTRAPFRYRFVQDSIGDDGHVVIRPTGPRTVVPLHRVVRRDLAVEVRRDRRPAPGLTLMGEGECVCMICSGRIGSTDQRGRTTVSPFFPEMWASVWLCDGDQVVWQADVKDLRPGVVRVSLPWTPPPTPPETTQARRTWCDKR